MTFDDDTDNNDLVFSYALEINDKKAEIFDESYVEDMEEYIGIHVVLPRKYSIPVHTKVIGRKIYHSGNLVGETNKKAILDTRIYYIEFPDGRKEEYSVNTILEMFLETIESDGWETGLLSEIL